MGKNIYLCISNMENMDINNDILEVMRANGIIGQSSLLMQAVNTAIQAAPFDVSVLVLGENGTGKEIFHKILHQRGPRKHSKCIAVNCGGLPEGTIDSELFGHMKGAFTGATSDRKGYFEEADGGTIFLDEVGELPLATQARLLRVLETGEYYRMGSSEVRKTNVRVVAATNVDLQDSIRRGKFREDLFYRLSTITINVPPLRKREEDIVMLFRKFSGDIANKYHMPRIQATPEAMRLLQSYQWPGNIRQLLHFVEQVSIVENGREVTPEIVHRYLPDFVSGVSLGGNPEGKDNSNGFLPGEKQMLYQMIGAMKRKLEELSKRFDGSVPVSSTTPEALQLPQFVPNSPIITIEPTEVVPSVQSKTDSLPTPANTKPITLDEMEKDLIKKALARNGGNKRKAAEELGISERTIHRKIETFGLE